MRKLASFYIVIMSMWVVFLPASGLLHPYSSHAGEGNRTAKPYSTPWVDSVFASLSLEERIAQLIMIDVRSDGDEEYVNTIARLVQEYNIGGVTFFRGSPTKQVLLTNRLQSQAKTPLFVSMDAEWGPAMRLDSLIAFPRQMALGAIDDNKLLYKMGLEIGRQLKRLGAHMNFAPVVDVNNNPDNPVINFRSFGENRYRVADKGLAYMSGLQDAGIIAVAKHFPGHGDTDNDSHHTLPLLNQSFEEVDSIHLFPFRKLINEGIHAVMVAHLEMPSLEPRQQLASTLSHNIVTKLLQNDLGFEGLVITDALQMKGVKDIYEPGEIELQALKAGNDILLIPNSTPATIKTIRDAVLNGRLSEDLINIKCRKVLYYKEKAGLPDFQFTPIDNIVEDINTRDARILNKRLAEASMTLVRNENNLIPLTGLDRKRIAALAIGASANNTFHKALGHYAKISNFGIDKYHSPARASQIKDETGHYDLVIISVQNNSFFPTNNYGINGRTIQLINDIAAKQEVILVLFANPYSLDLFDDNIKDLGSILIAYQDGKLFEEAAAQVVFGGLQSNGILPVSVSRHLSEGKSIITSEPFRLRFGYPEEAGVDSGILNRIDSIASKGIRLKAYPGCQIAIIKDGVMIYNKSFGHHRYNERQAVINTDIYDLASITKIAATTAAVMRLVDEGKLDLDEPISAYYPPIISSNKAMISLRQLLTHQAKLIPWIPFHLATIENNRYIRGIFSEIQNNTFPIQVANNLYINANYKDTIFGELFASDLRERMDYRYSDLGFMLLAEIIEEVSGKRIDVFADEFIFAPMGLSTMGFRPLDRFGIDRIVPTENDTRWRRQLLHGHVHDQTAAMLGGVSGHAGLFSNATDLAILMHVFLNEGKYGGIEFFDPATIREFTRVQYFFNDNRRGLGFDKPPIRQDDSSPVSISASPLSFGHSGFTGTLAWADPIENIVFVFLSNRIYPDASNRKINQENIRSSIQQTIYDAVYYYRISQAASQHD